MRNFLVTLFVVWLTSNTTPVQAEEPTLTLSFGQDVRVFSAAGLLARRDAANISVSGDAAYHRTMIYQAVPLINLFGAGLDTGFDTLEARAADGFVSQIPIDLVKRGRSNGSVAWIAIESPSKPWPDVPEKSQSAGPFYLVWQNVERSGIGPEQWPYALVALTGVKSPMQRWPQMAVTPSLPLGAPERRGMNVYIKHCLACHKIKGAGEATIGPDLAQPMSPTAYMSPNGLRLLIRDPRAVRTWPNQKMPGFTKETMPDAELEDLIVYLKLMAQSN